MEQKRPLLLLHGALYTADEFRPYIPLLEDRFQVHTLNFAGHGGTPFPDEPFSIRLFAQNVLDWMKGKNLGQVDIFGFSMGGYVGTYLARHTPERVGVVFTLGTKFHWDPESSARETGMLDAEKILAKVPRFAETLQQRHGEGNWREALARTAEMMTNLGNANELPPEEFAEIKTPIRVGLGDRDTMVTLDETVDRYRRLPNGEMIVLPNTPHPLERVPRERLAREIREFFTIL